MFQKLINWIDNYFSKKELDEILNLRVQIATLTNELKEKVEYLTSLEKTYDDLLFKLDKERELNELEIYWNEKRPHHEDYRRQVRTIPKKDTWIDVDPRIFFTPEDNKIPVIFGETNDEIAYKSLQWVHKNIKYTSDMNQFKETEEWLFAFETLDLKKGDCEDGAILLANMMLKSGIPYWRIRLNAGDVKGGGHAYVTYLREKDNKWIILDWCYWYDSNGKLWKNAEKYFSIWFSWNTKYIFYDEDFERTEAKNDKNNK